MRNIRLVLAVGLCLMLSASLAAQKKKKGEAPVEDEQTLSVNVDLVNVLFTVVDKNGMAVRLVSFGDVVSIISKELSELTGQQFIVDNKARSGGNVGTDTIAKSAPDGYTIGLYTIASQSIAPTLYGKLQFDVEKDFTPVAMLWSVPNMLMVRLDLPVKTVPALIALARAQPGKLSFASSGAGTTPHITGELFKQMAGVNLLHVPYKGSAPAYQDLLANQVDMMWDNIPGPLGLMKGGKVRGVAVTSKERHPAAPDVPTMAETLPGFEITSWGGICGPAGLPPAMVEKCAELARKALDSARVKAAFAQQGATSFWSTTTHCERSRTPEPPART